MLISYLSVTNSLLYSTRLFSISHKLGSLVMNDLYDLGYSHIEVKMLPS